MAKTVLVTGASRGIGQATAILFAKEGYNVVINYNHSREAAEELAKMPELVGKTIAVKADVSNMDEVEAMFQKAKAAFGCVDILVNNAGIAQQKLFTDLTVEDWNRIFSVNVNGVFNCCRCALPEMIKRHSGKIINISSVWGICGASCEVSYSASKSAVIGLTKALSKEVGPSNIQVNCIAPGIIETEMNAALNIQDCDALCDETPLGRFGSPIEIAHSILFLASERADFITGQVLGVNGGFLI
jgi:3-oxoacyl-[acyl-carrier protein] reductase